MEPVVSSPIIIPQIPQRFSEEHLDEYRNEYRDEYHNEAVEIFVEHPPSLTLDLLEDSLSFYHGGSYGSLRSFTPPPPSSWDRFWSCC